MSDKYDLFYVSKSNKYSSSMDDTPMTAHAYNLKQLGFIAGNTKEFYNNEFHNLNTFKLWNSK